MDAPSLPEDTPTPGAAEPPFPSSTLSVNPSSHTRPGTQNTFCPVTREPRPHQASVILSSPRLSFTSSLCTLLSPSPQLKPSPLPSAPTPFASAQGSGRGQSSSVLGASCGDHDQPDLPSEPQPTADPWPALPSDVKRSPDPKQLGFPLSPSPQSRAASCLQPLWTNPRRKTRPLCLYSDFGPPRVLPSNYTLNLTPSLAPTPSPHLSPTISWKAVMACHWSPASPPVHNTRQPEGQTTSLLRIL